ncbi:lipase [Sphingomonas metalli]|uniref:Lipase n=1 Tax=Sphingomonas metalli TaxID=1779358 RepID=A0A916TE50_9SPHN|nr:SGNH/GDSL hydrolase family protein [Sphingomonas metalli]GGB40049.1 lipase [Sphingomonas metalli]
MPGYHATIRLALVPCAALMLAAGDAPPARVRITPVPQSADERGGTWLDLHRGGRQVVDAASPHGALRQWPGSYVEGRFRGPAVDLAIGPGEVALHVSIDGAPPVALVRPAPGRYRVAAGSGTEVHRIRVDVVSESQSGPTRFDGILAPAGTRALPPPAPRSRQIEFIGDSHTVGYGNTSPVQDCTPDAVWRTTDTAAGPAGQLAGRYAADYRVNAISGRGVVRNYGGFDAPTLPRAYPFALLDGTTPDRSPGWHPQVIVIGLGTNDFSTALKPGERWPDRAALHADYEQRYADFIASLRRRDRQALIVIWATDIAEGEVATEAARVVARRNADGDRRVVFVRVPGLGFQGCHGHPDLADDRAIAHALAGAIDARADTWTRGRR